MSATLDGAGTLSVAYVVSQKRYNIYISTRCAVSYIITVIIVITCLYIIQFFNNEMDVVSRDRNSFAWRQKREPLFSKDQEDASDKKTD